VYVAPSVQIGDGTVVGARSSVFKDLPANKVCIGSPAIPIKDRIPNIE
jgi:putative colanic acid biosynthesis acetyltransferase WcaF